MFFCLFVLITKRNFEPILCFLSPFYVQGRQATFREWHKRLSRKFDQCFSLATLLDMTEAMVGKKQRHMESPSLNKGGTRNTMSKCLVP